MSAPEQLRPPAALVRALVLGLAGVGLAVLAHGSADGALPPLWVLLASWATLSVLALANARREWGLLPLLGSLASTQTGLHLLFVRSGTGSWTHGGSVGWLCCGPGTPVPAGPGVSVAGVGLDRAAVVQLVCRAVAVVICAWWLRRGEARVWTAARIVVRGVTRRLGALLQLLLAPVLTPRSRVFAPRSEPLPGLLFILSSSTSRRGPPALAQR